MAVKLQTARKTFLKAIREFPRWMSIRKRPDKAVSGLHLASIIDEQTDIAKELDKFIKEFFLITYVGKESEIVDYVYIIQVGSLDVSATEVIHPSISLTADPKFWLNNQNLYALYQGGYIIISAVNLPEDEILTYTYNGYRYGGKLQRYHVWNIFDEFAMFLSLERFSDVGETNAELLKRCFLVFQNPANSTARGLQNTIMNCMSNDIVVNRENIKIEIPDSENMWLPDETYGTIYERFAQMNRDVFRTKNWNIDDWEHNFKRLEYLPHQWDKELDVYQDGTGQMDDLSVTLSLDEEDTTGVSVKGFKKDKAAINEYFHNQNIKKNINLNLKRYSNILKPQKVQYKITATPIMKIQPDKIYVREQTLISGSNTYDLQDLVTRAGNAKVSNPGELTAGKKYELVFKPAEDYSDMQIRKINLVSSSGTEDLMKENRQFIMTDKGYLRHVDVLHHIKDTSGFKDSENIIDTTEGMTLARGTLEGTFTVDVTGCGGKIIKIDSIGDMFDVTEQSNLWKLEGLKIKDKKLSSTSRSAANETATLEMDCMGYTYTLEKSQFQGTAVVKVWVDGKLNSSLSGQLNKPNEPITNMFDKLTHVKIVFTKSGEYPFSIKDIRATKYKISCEIDHGEIIQGTKSMSISNVPDTQQNTLTVTVKAYDVAAPIIRYVHIGPSVARASYTVKDINGTNGTYLDIDTDCIVSLYETVGKSRILVKENFVTKKIYANSNTDDVIYLELDTDAFTQINSSSKKISKTSRNGQIVSYITLSPGEKVSNITIDGTMYKNKSRRSIKSLFGWKDTYNIYVAKNAKGFIVRNTTNNEEWLDTIPKSMLSGANVISYEGLPDGTSGFFCVNRDRDVVTISDSTDRNFEDTYISMQDAKEYMAYNEIDMYKSSYGESENITISNTFTPIINLNQLFFYTISDISSTGGLTAVASFKKYRHSKSNYYGIPFEARKRVDEIISMFESGSLQSEVASKLDELNKIYNIDIKYSSNLIHELNELLEDGSWSVGQKELYITTDFDFGNSNNYEVSVNSISPEFSISNEIELSRTININGVEEDIAQYIIEPPSNMKVIFGDTDDTIEQAESLIVNEDGFNKLKYSNVRSVQGLFVDGAEYRNYTLLKKEGVIVWNDVKEIAGKFFAVAYEYDIPTGLKYNDISYLYDMVSYTVDAFLPVEVTSKIPDELSDGDSFLVEFVEPVDYVPKPECSNSNFSATYNNGMVTVQRLYNDNVAIVRAGYYYDNDDEYYYYNHDFFELVNSFNNVTLHNVKKMDTTFIFMIATSNYLPSTRFKPGRNYEKLCYVDFNDPRVESTGISKLDIITACESYNSWMSFNMAITFVDGINGIGMMFRPDDEVAYGVFNLTKYLTANTLVSLFATNGIELAIFKERKAGDDSMRKSIFAEPFAEFTKLDNFYGWEVPEDIDLDYQYFLIVRGTGIIDDIIIRDGVSILEQFSLHVKNVDFMGLDVDEIEAKGYQQKLAFDPDGCNLDNLEITRDNTIQIGSNVDYGVTKIWEMQDDYESCTASTSITRNKGTFVTGDSNGWVKTPMFYVENNSSIAMLYVKVNNLLVSNMKNFAVTAYVADEEDGILRSLGKTRKTNLATFVGSQLSSYLQLEIELEKNKIIDSIEVYARYAENEQSALRIQNHKEGSIVTKVYDVGSENSYKLVGVLGEVEQKKYFKLYMRGCKQDATNIVWTDWYEIHLDSNLNTTGYPHIFENYRFFQFRMDFDSSHVTAKISDFVLEVV